MRRGVIRGQGLGVWETFLLLRRTKNKQTILPLIVTCGLMWESLAFRRERRFGKVTVRIGENEALLDHIWSPPGFVFLAL